MAWKHPKKTVWYNEKMQLLMAGCHTHPGYRALKKPTADCKVCRKMFKVAQELERFGFIEREVA